MEVVRTSVLAGLGGGEGKNGEGAAVAGLLGVRVDSVSSASSCGRLAMDKGT